MLPDQPVYHTLASPFRELWLKWDLAQRTGHRPSGENEESVREEAARSQFIEALLDGRSGGGGGGGSGGGGGGGDVGRSTEEGGDGYTEAQEGGGSWEHHEAKEAERAQLEQQRTAEQRQVRVKPRKPSHTGAQR